jgi:hypothetical protein
MQRPTGGKGGDFAQLRDYFDGAEPYITNGSNIKTPRSVAQTKRYWQRENAKLGGIVAAHNRWHRDRGIVNPECELCNPALPRTISNSYAVTETPEWIFNYKEVAKFLLKHFPKMHTPTKQGQRQRFQAGRWAVLINEYFRLGRTAQHIADDNAYLFLGDAAVVTSLLQQVRFAMNNLRLDGKKPTGRKPGRPKKSVESAPLPNIEAESRAELEIVHSLQGSFGRGITSPVAVTTSHPGGAYAAPPSF